MVPTYQAPSYQVEYNYLPSISPARPTIETLPIPSTTLLPPDDEDDSEVLTGLGLYDESAEDSAPLMLTEEYSPPPESEEDAEGEDEDEEEEENESPEVEPRTPEQPLKTALPEPTAAGGKTFTPASYWWTNQAGSQYISEPQIQGQQHTWQGIL
jgi:hypothetical protein